MTDPDVATGAAGDLSDEPVPVDPESLYARYRGGETELQLATAYGVKVDTVRRWLQRAGLRERRKRRPKPRRRIDGDEVWRLFESGLSPYAVAKAMRISNSTARNIIKKRGGQLGGQRVPLTKAEAAEAIRLYASGLTLKQVAAEIGRSYCGARNAVIAAGGPLRPGGRSGVQSLSRPRGSVMSEAERSPLPGPIDPAVFCLERGSALSMRMPTDDERDALDMPDGVPVAVVVQSGAMHVLRADRFVFVYE